MTIAKPTTSGPQIGAPPSLEQVPIARLQVDAAYQRATDGPASRKIIAGMVAQWDWRLCQPLVVSRRSDGALFILDGQHRHAGAAERGDIPFLPCVLLSSLDHVDEANTFIALNTRRQKLSQADIFHGQLAAGLPAAIRVADMLAETGWQIRKSSNSAQFTVGDMTCAPMLVRRLANGEEAQVRFALVALRTAWPDKPVRSTATFLKALIDLFNMLAPCAPDARPDDCDLRIQRIAKLLGTKSQDRWMLAAGTVRSAKPDLSVPAALARAIHQLDSPRSYDTPPPAIAAPAQAVAARPKVDLSRVVTPSNRSPFTLEDGRAWCSQCEQRRTRANAATCKDKFCKLKGAL